MGSVSFGGELRQRRRAADEPDSGDGCSKLSSNALGVDLAATTLGSMPMDRTAMVSKGLKALIERESARRLARLGGTQPKLKAAPSRRQGSPA